MYEKYSTDALVLDTRPLGESDALVTLYAREFGLIRARAGAARAEHSKMRGALSVSNVVHANLIQGKVGWRLAGVEAHTLQLPGAAYHVCGRVFMLVRRLVHGEEKHEYLYETLVAMRTVLETCPEESYPLVELVSVARTLFALGYISSEAVGEALFAHTAFEMDDLGIAARSKSKLLGAVNSALAASQL